MEEQNDGIILPRVIERAINLVDDLNQQRYMSMMTLDLLQTFFLHIETLNQKMWYNISKLHNFRLLCKLVFYINREQYALWRAERAQQEMELSQSVEVNSIQNQETSAISAVTNTEQVYIQQVASI